MGGAFAFRHCGRMPFDHCLSQPVMRVTPLSQLRQAYLKQMTMRVKSKSLDEDRVAMTLDQRELRFLEKNLEELTRANKKV